MLTAFEYRQFKHAAGEVIVVAGEKKKKGVSS